MRGCEHMERLHFVDACTEEHFSAMSRIHAMGWRDTYQGYVPDDYMAREITDERWVAVFRQNYESGMCHGLLLYRDDTPVSCINYCRARTDNYNPGEKCRFHNENYKDWGEIASFYTHPEERGRGYGGRLLDEAVCRLQRNGYENVFVFVLRENEKARRFYARHGFSWDGTHADIPFPHNTVCVDLRYVKTEF